MDGNDIEVDNWTIVMKSKPMLIELQDLTSPAGISNK